MKYRAFPIGFKCVKFYGTLLTLILCFHAQAQIATRALASSQPSKAFMPMTATMINGDTLHGYGFVNVLTGQSFVYSPTPPQGETTEDWRLLKDIKAVSVFAQDTISYIRFDNGKSKGEWYTRKVYEDDELIIGRMSVSYLRDTYCYRYKNDPSRWTLKTSAISLENDSIFKRSTKNSFRKCEELMKKFNAGTYPRSLEGIIQMLKDGAHCD